MHHGHRALLVRALGAGQRMGLPTGAVTFVRHPHAYLYRGETPPALCGLADRLRLLRDAGAAFVVLLHRHDGARAGGGGVRSRGPPRPPGGPSAWSWAGNFRFGRGGAGDVGTLSRLVSVTGLDGVKLGMVSVGGEAVSATLIREYLTRGDVDRAADLLGRPYDVTGRLDGTAALIRIAPGSPCPPRGATGSRSGRSDRETGGRRRSSRFVGRGRERIA